MVLINRASVIDVLCKQRTFEPKHGRTIVRSIQLIMEQPKVDAAPVVHGHWEVAIGYDINRKVKCSECNRMNFEPSDFCPNCGARMDEEVIVSEME